MTMELEESILQTAFLEGPRDCNGLIKDASGVITNADGTKRIPYARILIRPTVLEVARNYARGITGVDMYDPSDTDTMAALGRLEEGMDDEGLQLFEAIVASAFLEGGIFCATDGSRRAAFLKLAEKCGG